MTAGTRKDPRDFRQRQIDRIFETDRLHPEREGANPFLGRVDLDPPNTGQMLIVADLAAQQTYEQTMTIVMGDPMHHPIAAAAALESHHEAWLRWRSAPAREPQGE